MTFAAAPATLPADFTLLFNGKDLTGWHGRGHVDPRSVWALSATAQEAQRAKSRRSSRSTGGSRTAPW
jgi:hypothetical protein